MSDSFASTGLEPQPYELEWKRTNPDYLVYHPAPDGQCRWEDDDFLVLNEESIIVPTAGGDLLATWTAHGPKLQFQRVVASISEDKGKTWSAPVAIDGKRGESAAWQVPIATPPGRIYVMYCKYPRRRAGRMCALGCCISDDEGRSWSSPVEIPLKRRIIDNPDPDAPIAWIGWRQVEWDSKGRAIFPFTRFDASHAGGHRRHQWCQSEFMRFENIASAPAPEDLEIAWLPAGDGRAVTVPNAEGSDVSWANEPNVVPLPDGRLFMSVRTRRGTIWYSVSEDNGDTLREAQVMRYRDDGQVVLQPSSPAPIYRLKDGRFLLLYNNNDGNVFGAPDVHDTKNRRPAYFALGEFRPNARQPIWWSDPKLFVDNDGIPIDVVGNVPRYEAAAYTGFTEIAGERVLWYPDRKHFLVGKIITDEWLSDMQVPE